MPKNLRSRLLSGAVGLLSLVPAPVTAQLASLVADISPAAGAGPGSEPHAFLPLGDRVVFIASHPLVGPELWASDGTPEGTELLGDTDPVAYLGHTPELLFFSGRVIAERARLWRTDGTRHGTFPLGEPAGVAVEENLAAVANGELFFLGWTAEAGEGLWASDSTEEGTRFLKEIVPGGGRVFLEATAVLGDRFYFIASGDAGWALWTSDGTAAATRRVYTPPAAYPYPYPPRSLAATTQRLSFLLENLDAFRVELWSSDGTPEGTHKVLDFPQQEASVPFLALNPLGDRVFFAVEDFAYGEELWSSDGTADGTRRLTDFASPFPFDAGDPLRVGPSEVARLGDFLFFLAAPTGQEVELWKTGVDANRMERLAVLSGPPPCKSALTSKLVQTADRVFFARCLSGSTSLWSTDRTSGSTLQLSNVHTDFFKIAGDDEEVYFSVWTFRLDQELFSSDGTPSGTRRRTQVDRPYIYQVFWPPDERPALVGETLFFAVDDGEHGREPWVVEATPETTRLLRDLSPPEASSFPRDVVEAPGGALFIASDGQAWGLWHTSGSEDDAVLQFQLTETGCYPTDARLVRSGPRIFLLCYTAMGGTVLITDGSLAGTQPLLQLDSPPQSIQFVEFGGRTYLGGGTSSPGGGGGGGLWRTDGTLEGTEQFLSEVDLQGAFVSELTSLGDELYLVSLSNPVRQVYRTDGTRSGTRSLLATEGNVLGFWELLGGIYFVAGDFELWRTDGTAAGTEMAVDLGELGALWLSRRSFAVLEDRLYFLANVVSLYGSRGGLWQTDGTPAGTLLLADGLHSFEWTPELATLGDTVFFVARDDEHGQELWRSDGTATGTTLWADLLPGPDSSTPTALTQAGDRLFFSARTLPLGRELWASDGTTAGTRLVHDVAPGPFPSLLYLDPRTGAGSHLYFAGSHLYFAADDALHGVELWRLPLDETGCVESGRGLCLQRERFRVEIDWVDFQGDTGRGTAVPLTSDTGYFWFFRDSNVETVLKVLDGRPRNQHFWVFYGALSNVEYNITLTDAETGVSRRYFNPSGNLASRADTAAFGPRGSSLETFTPPTPELLATMAGSAFAAASRVAATGSCSPSPTRLCLQGGRFAVEAAWRDFRGNTGVGTAVGLTPDTGCFWFFRDSNVELVAKVLDGTGLNGHFWFFYGALSNVEYRLTVTDTLSGQVRTYFNPAGRFASVGDTAAF